MTPRGWVALFIGLVFVVTVLYTFHTMHESEGAEMKRLEAELSGRGFRYVILPPDLTMHHEWEGCLMIDDVVLRVVKAQTKLGAMRKLVAEMSALDEVPA